MQKEFSSQAEPGDEENMVKTTPGASLGLTRTTTSHFSPHFDSDSHEDTAGFPPSSET